MSEDVPRRALLEAATTLLAEEGPGALTVRRIAAGAACTTMAIYSGFGGKNGIIDALVSEGFDRLFQAIIAIPTALDPIEAITEFSHAYRTVALAHPTSYTLMFERVPGYVPSQEARRRCNQGYAALVATVERAVTAGALAGPAETTAHLLWALWHGLISLELHAMSGGIDNEAAYLTGGAALLDALRVVPVHAVRSPGQ